MAIPGSRGGSKKSVGSIWDLDWKLTSTVHGDSYKVVDRSTRQNLLVWVSRVPLEKGEEKGVLRRMSRLVSFSTLPVVAHGIDRLGVGYIGLQIEGCSPLESNKPSLLEARYRFVECVAKIARFHEAGLALENICPGSFVLDADQEVAFVGFLGGFSVSDMAAVPLEVRACLPVSTLSGLLSGVKADVYALAVLGLRLFGAQFPPSGINPEEVDQYLERIPDSAPRWIPHVLGPIVKQPQRSALRDAVDLLSALAEQERRAPPSMLESGPKGSGEDAKLVGNKRVSLELLLSVQEIATRVRLRDKSLRQPFMRRFIRGRVSQLLVICILAFVAIKAGLIPLAWLSESLSWSSQSLKLAPLNVPTGVERKDETSDGSTQSFADLIANLERIHPGENHDDLWQVVFTRLTEKGYHTTAATTASAVSDGAGPVRQPAALARVVHPEISTQERIHRLRSYEALVPESAGRVAAALAQDDPRDRELYRDFLMSSVRRLVAPSASDQVSERSTSALIVALGGRNEISAALNAALMKNISSADLWWLVNFHIEKRSDKLPIIFDMVLSKGACEGLRRVFLEFARQAEIGPNTPYEALVHSAQHGPTVQNVTLFSEWLAPQSEQTLYAVLLTSTDPGVLTAALNGLRSKPQLDGLVVDVIDVVGSRGDSEVVRYASLIGTLGLRSILQLQTIVEGLESAKDKPLASLIAQRIFERGDPSIIEIALTIYGQTVHPSFLLPLLKHPDSEIRLQVVPLVKDLPLASSRAELKSLYAAEEDPRVRSAYENEGVVTQ